MASLTVADCEITPVLEDNCSVENLEEFAGGQGSTLEKGSGNESEKGQKEANDDAAKETEHMDVEESKKDDSEGGRLSQGDNDDGKKSEEEGEEGVKCGFLVDRISTMPYQKAVERGEVPFCAFAPISTQDLYLLRIQECADTTRHMLVPASKEEVFSMPGALKSMDDDQEPGNEDAMNYKVAIVAIARQIYSEEDKQLVVSVDPPLKKDKKRIQIVKFLTLDKFADFAFLGFDGNVSEFANANNSNETNSKEGNASNTNCEHNQGQQPPVDERGAVSTPAVPISVKSPPKAPARRGRGGRRRMSRKSPVTSSPRHALLAQPQQPLGHFYPPNFQHLSSVTLPQDLPTDFTQAFIKMEQGENETQQFISQGYHSHQMPLTQVPVMDSSSLYTQDSFMTSNEMPMSMLQVPNPVSEITISTTEPGADAGAQQTNHDLITIAFDQLVGVGPEVPSSEIQIPEKSSRGGRRGGPGRKPGRKPLKERHPNQIDIVMDENAMFGQVASDDVPVAPRRRGRPPKNRIPLQYSGQEIENSNPSNSMEGELRDEFDNYDKRIVKMQVME